MQNDRHYPFTLCFATFLSPVLYDAYAFIARFIGEQIECPSQLTVGHSLEEFVEGEAHIGFVCGLLYSQRTHCPFCPIELLAAPVPYPPRYQGKPLYFSDVIVHKESSFASFEDLQGCRWGYNERVSHSGWNLVRYSLYKQGHTPHFFGNTVETGSHQRSIEMVIQGKVEAAAIDSLMLDLFLLDNPDLAAQIRVIATLGYSSCCCLEKPGCDAQTEHTSSTPEYASRPPGRQNPASELDRALRPCQRRALRGYLSYVYAGTSTGNLPHPKSEHVNMRLPFILCINDGLANFTG